MEFTLLRTPRHEPMYNSLFCKLRNRDLTIQTIGVIKLYTDYNFTDYK